MPDATVILPGFFGKLPSMGDFVTRGLPSSFVGAWDRWISRHMVARFANGEIGDYPVLRFIVGADAFGPMAGVIMASEDRTGRRFPLTIAAAPRVATAGIPTGAAGWFDDLEQTGAAARDGRLHIDELSAGLARLPLPVTAPPRAVVAGMVFWTQRNAAPVNVNVAAPGSALLNFFPEPMETG